VEWLYYVLEVIHAVLLVLSFSFSPAEFSRVILEVLVGLIIWKLTKNCPFFRNYSNELFVFQLRLKRSIMLYFCSLREIVCKVVFLKPLGIGGSFHDWERSDKSQSF
jgi:hypothetical protein